MSEFGWMTLATNDTYCLGALVLAHSLRRVETKHRLAVIITPQVSPAMRDQLSRVFDVIHQVDVLDSNDAANLALLQRPDLGVTFTKIHCWNLTMFKKCVFIDADTLIVQNCDELFERDELSASPDPGWPDCFNSGVFVFVPSQKTFNDLLAFASTHGSFDGGDQGLLNMFFSDWSSKDISKHLPFLYNMCSTSTYTYLPALKYYGGNIKIVHFIGSNKPWLQGGSGGSLSGFLQTWWQIFESSVAPNLNRDMSGLAGALGSREKAVIEEQWRKQNWEQGNIDYTGKDSFDNIWQKIISTMNKAGTKQPTVIPSTQEKDTPKKEESVKKDMQVIPFTPPPELPKEKVVIPLPDKDASEAIKPTTELVQPQTPTSVLPQPGQIEISTEQKPQSEAPTSQPPLVPSPVQAKEQPTFAQKVSSTITPPQPSPQVSQAPPPEVPSTPPILPPPSPPASQPPPTVAPVVQPSAIDTPAVQPTPAAPATPPIQTPPATQSTTAVQLTPLDTSASQPIPPTTKPTPPGTPSSEVIIPTVTAPAVDPLIPTAPTEQPTVPDVPTKQSTPPGTPAAEATLPTAQPPASLTETQKSQSAAEVAAPPTPSEVSSVEVEAKPESQLPPSSQEISPLVLDTSQNKMGDAKNEKPFPPPVPTTPTDLVPKSPELPLPDQSKSEAPKLETPIEEKSGGPQKKEDKKTPSPPKDEGKKETKVVTLPASDKKTEAKVPSPPPSDQSKKLKPQTPEQSKKGKNKGQAPTPVQVEQSKDTPKGEAEVKPEQGKNGKQGQKQRKSPPGKPDAPAPPPAKQQKKQPQVATTHPLEQAIAPLTPPPSPLEKAPSEQPSSPIVTAATPPVLLPEVAAPQDPLSAKLKVEEDIPQTPPVGASTADPPVPPKRKGKGGNNQERKPQNNGGKGKGKK